MKEIIDMAIERALDSGGVVCVTGKGGCVLIGAQRLHFGRNGSIVFLGKPEEGEMRHMEMLQRALSGDREEEARPMTLTLELTPEQEEIVARAREQGVDVDALLLSCIDSLTDIDLPALPEEEAVLRRQQQIRDAARLSGKPQNGKELVEALTQIGFIGSRPDIKDSVEYARELRRRAWRRPHIQALRSEERE